WGQCQHTDWIGLCWAILGQPVGTRGWQWAASGGNIPLSTAKSASTRSIHVSYWDRWCGTARIMDQHSLASSKELTSFSSTTYDSCSDCRIQSSLQSGRCGTFRLQKIRRDNS